MHHWLPVEHPSNDILDIQDYTVDQWLWWISHWKYMNLSYCGYPGYLGLFDGTAPAGGGYAAGGGPERK